MRTKTGKGKIKRGSSEKDAGILFMDCSHQLPSKHVTKLAKDPLNVCSAQVRTSYKLNSGQKIKSCRKSGEI